jgi:two-component system response regulator MprA
MLPKIDGLEVCRRIRAAGDATPILMLTARSSVPDRVAGLDTGADDYLVKPFAQEELLARIRRLLRSHESKEVLSYGPIRIDVQAMEVTVNDEPAQLTALEFRLLEYLMRNPRVVLSRGQILDAVWGLDAFTTSNVVDVYVRYLRQKLPNAATCIRTVRGVGYVLKES